MVGCRAQFLARFLTGFQCVGELFANVLNLDELAVAIVALLRDQVEGLAGYYL